MQIPGSRFELGAFRQFAPSSTQIGVAVMLKSAQEAFLLAADLPLSSRRASCLVGPTHS
ncbi:hypothetical protein SynPROS91_00547 [Synechococcus sp. PROS-9-1]|nr:hypothetical protein SynPROS91_00547 [Synechococcus sp. PROS-9-1]